MDDKWKTTLDNIGFVKAIVSREFSAFIRFEEDLVSEGIIAYYNTIGKIKNNGMRWIAIRNKLWQYIDEKILCEKNHNRKYSVSHRPMSEYASDDDGDKAFAMNHLLDNNCIIDTLYHNELLDKLMSKLDSFDKKILNMLLDEYSQVEIASILGVESYIVYGRMKSIRKKAKEIANDYK